MPLSAHPCHGAAPACRHCSASRSVYGTASDLGHWDVPDACAVLPEAWELVEHGHNTAEDFKAFTHDNALALWGDEMFGNTVTAAR